jgi:DNA mismatch repair ATPase MutS
VTWTESGGLFYQVLNLILLMDVLVAHGILRVAVPLRRPLLQGVATVRDVDALCSLAAFAAEQPRRCWPELVDDLQLTITRGTHPLLDPGRAVPNDLTLHHDCRLWIVTGSNMAGKSTYLRMIGLNVLFAQVGTAVCAEALSLCPLRLVSDLRARDDLGRNESYFLAEVRHLRRMVLPPPGATPILGLIDEPFRGTNSDDQTAASVAVVRHLLEQPNLYVLATHDRHLTGLADGVRARNWHFQENITADEMVFDYRLHAGPAQTRNALRILERELYPPELVTAARRWLEQSDS